MRFSPVLLLLASCSSSSSAPERVTYSNTIAALVKGFNGLVYCQSPSGAFVDGSASF